MLGVGVIPPMGTVHGKRTAVLKITLNLTPEEEPGAVKALVCAGGEFLDLDTEFHAVGKWLRREISHLRKT